MTGWSEERVERLIELWNSGLSASQVAKRLGGVTRSAIIGKLYRLGVPQRSIDAERRGARLTRARRVPPALPDEGKPYCPVHMHAATSHSSRRVWTEEERAQAAARARMRAALKQAQAGAA